MPDRNRKILELRHITAGYRDNIVLENVDFTVHQTDFIGVIGANGRGKTTLLKVILGLIRPIEGEVSFYFDEENGHNGSGAKAKQLMGYLPQVAVFDRKFPVTVFDVVLSGLAVKTGLFKQFSRGDKQRALEVMERMGVIHMRKQVIGELSGGQMQRVFLARALVNSPRLLLLDEPNTFVDKSFEKGFFDVLVELNKEIAIILVSHDLGMVSSFVKTLACVNRSVFHHDSNEITQEFLDNYNCPFDLVSHGDMPHRVLKTHTHKPGESCHCRLVKEQAKHTLEPK
jgi:zinc transport system ATP-binding protein